MKSLFNEKHIRKNLLWFSICMLLNITCLLVLCNISHSVFWRAVVFTVAQIAVPRTLFPLTMYSMTCFQLEFDSNFGSNNYCNFFWSHGNFFDTVSYDYILLGIVYFTVHCIALWKRHKLDIPSWVLWTERGKPKYSEKTWHLVSFLSEHFRFPQLILLFIR